MVTDEEGGLFSLFIAYQPNIAHIGSYEIVSVAELEDAMMKFDTFFFYHNLSPHNKRPEVN